MDATSATQVIKTRLNMIRIYGNYKGDLTLPRPCPLCKMEDDTTEHLVSCQELGITINDFKILKKCKSKADTAIYEALLIKKLNPVLNHNLKKPGWTWSLQLFG